MNKVLNKSGQTYDSTILTMYLIHCCECGVPFAIPDTLAGLLRNQRVGEFFYCPNGHKQHFTGKSEAQKERERREAAEKNAKYAWDRFSAEQEAREATERILSATRGHLTRKTKEIAVARQRIGHGTCPCCNRTFQNLQRHMTQKHPKYATPPKED